MSGHFSILQPERQLFSRTAINTAELGHPKKDQSCPNPLRDEWHHQRVISPLGATDLGCTSGDDPAPGGDPFAVVCPPSAQDARYCTDPSGSYASAQRIDYLFVQLPDLHHNFNLDITRLCRRHFRRPGITFGQRYLSDHLGWDCRFIASQK